MKRLQTRNLWVPPAIPEPYRAPSQPYSKIKLCKYSSFAGLSGGGKVVRASGPVTVQVLVDTSGDVTSATAVSGHPLLRATAVQAARSAKFARTLLSGQPVSVSGVIVYNFAQ